MRFKQVVCCLPTIVVAIVETVSAGRAVATTALIMLLGLPLAAHAASPSTFTVVALPDTQYYSASYPNIFTSQTQWIVSHQTSQNIAFVSQQGDLVDNAKQPNQWTNADSAMYLLDNTNPRLPWGTCPGNHDMNQFPGEFATAYDENFGPSHFTGLSWYGGSYENSSYQTFTAGGRQYLMLDLQYYPTYAEGDVFGWAQGVINSHPDMPTIINTHDYLMSQDERSDSGEGIWNSLVYSNEQVFAVFCGHLHGEYTQISTDAAGKPVFELLADFQSGPNGGNGYMRLYQFDEANSAIHVKTYSPYDTSGGTGGTYMTDANSQFDLPIDFNDRFGTPFPNPPPSSFWASVP